VIKSPFSTSSLDFHQRCRPLTRTVYFPTSEPSTSIIINSIPWKLLTCSSMEDKPPWWLTQRGKRLESMIELRSRVCPGNRFLLCLALRMINPTKALNDTYSPPLLAHHSLKRLLLSRDEVTHHNSSLGPRRNTISKRTVSKVLAPNHRPHCL